jgi:Family of unknown function (DUF6152)
MKYSSRWLLTGLLAGTALAPLAYAHHSGAMFDMQKELTLQGTVKDFQYTNPHSWLIVLVKDKNGADVEWSFETEGPSTLLQAGIKRSSLQAGDKVTVKTHPMKDGRPAGTWNEVTKSDGTILTPRAPPPPPGGGTTANPPAPG